MADADMRESWTIAELSDEFDLTARAIRYYEEQGLVRPERVGGQRIYGKGDRARLAWIKRARNVGFSLSEIRELIDLYDRGDGRRTQRKVTLARCRDRIRTLERQQEDIASALAELRGFVAQLEAMGEPDEKEY